MLITVAVVAPMAPAVALMPSAITRPVPNPVETDWSCRSVMPVRLALVKPLVVAVLSKSRPSVENRITHSFAVVVVTLGHDAAVLAVAFDAVFIAPNAFTPRYASLTAPMTVPPTVCVTVVVVSGPVAFCAAQYSATDPAVPDVPTFVPNEIDVKPDGTFADPFAAMNIKIKSSATTFGTAPTENEVAVEELKVDLPT